MEYKKTIILLALVVFLLSIAGVSASEIDNTIASENANTIELSTDNDIEDNLQTSEENGALASTDYDEAIAQTDTEVLGADSATYSNLAAEISQPGNITLTHKNYTYDKDATAITISEANKVIDGNGAIIDMNGSTIRAFYISGSGVTIKNLTIKNANYNGNGGAIYFSNSATSGTVSNCNFADNTATLGGAIFFVNTGNVTNCNFTDNTASSQGGAIRFSVSGTVTNCNFTNSSANGAGGAVYFYDNSEVTNCNFIYNVAKSSTLGGGAIFFMISGNVAKCNFTDNSASFGGAVLFGGKGNISNSNFTNNSASNGGGAINMASGSVENCNFTDNKATSSSGGSIWFTGNGDVINCIFTNNSATGDGGAVYFYEGATGRIINCNFTDNTANRYGGAINMGDGTVSNCNFTNNSARYGGAIRFDGEGTVTNCNFTGNTATQWGGAVYFYGGGTVKNCNFADNKATGEDSLGGAIFMYSGSVENCNFTNNSASSQGGAIRFSGPGTVTNCNFTNNSASSQGGAIRFSGTGTVTNCNFTGNNATTGSAIYFWSTSSTKTVSNSRFLNNRANSEALEVTKNNNNITITFTGNDNLLNAIYSREDAEVTFTNVTYWGAKGITTVSARLSGSNKAAGQNITVGVVVNGEIVLNQVNVTNEDGTIVLNINAGENYYITARHDTDSYYTEAEKAISNNTKFNVNVTSQTTNNKTVNITAKSNIPQDVVQGKLLFIVPNTDPINATYAGNGTWWAVYTFDDYAVYEVNATYSGLDNVTINNATITINKANSTLTVGDIEFDYNSSGSTTVSYDGATGVNASVVDQPNAVVKVVGNTITVSGLNAGTYNLTVTTIADADHNNITKTSTITVNKINSTLTIGDIVFDYNSTGSGSLSFTGASGVNASVVDQPNAVVKVNTDSITVSGLNAGNYTLTVTTIADANHNNVTKTANITVNKVDSTLTVDNIVFDYGSTGSTKVSYTGATGVNASVVGQPKAVVNVKNNTITVSGLDAGTYKLTVTTIADANHNNVTKTSIITVNKLKTELTASAVTATYNINKDLVITLKDSTGKALSGVKVTVDLNGAKEYATDSNGQVKVSTKGLAPKTYTAKITFNGDTNYDKFVKEVKVTVKKATPKITAKKKTFKATTKTKKYTITLKDNTGKAIKNAKVTLIVNGKTYKATTNSKGKATFKITKLNKKGAYKATVTSKGNKYYNKATKKVKITVKASKIKSTFKTVSQGSKDTKTVKKIQQALKDNGYYLTYQGHYLKVDGKYDSCTVRSVKEFQNDKGLKVTGKVDQKTAKKLGII